MPPSLECLESRLALTVLASGNVNAQILGFTLLLTGDALDNALVVSTATGGKMAVLGIIGTDVVGVVAAALGNGRNFTRIDGNGSTFGSLAYTGGTGTNTLTTNAATRSGIRTLKYFQFQTVNTDR